MGTQILEPLFDVEQYRPQIVLVDTVRVHESDPITSHQAADSITAEGRQGSQQYVLNQFLTGCKAAWEVEERSEILGGRYSPSRIRTAVKELEGLGRIARLSGVGITPRGFRCDHFEVTL